MADESNPKLTPEQIANWRKILSVTLGPYAFMMPEEEIQNHRDRMQAHHDIRGIGQMIPPSPMLIGKDPEPINYFHKHLDTCSRCANNPFSLCADGKMFLEKQVKEEAEKIVKSSESIGK